MAELKITAANFENEVLHSDKPVLLDFYADWCGPCKMLSPVLHEIAEENAGALKVGKVNVDEQMELAMRFSGIQHPDAGGIQGWKGRCQIGRLSAEIGDRRNGGGRKMKVVIVGGVAGGASAAARIRRLDEHAQIIMIERSGYMSYANCGLPYYVGGVIKEQEELTLQTPESFWEDLPCDGSATLLDVRTEGEYRRGHLNGFRNIPLDDLREHLDELDRGKPVYVNCQTGLRSYLACRLLTQYGFTCAHLSGGYSFYQVVTQERQTARSAYPCGMEKL